MSRRSTLLVCAIAALGLVARAGAAQRRARVVTGEPPAVSTDDGVLLHTEVEGPRTGLSVVLVHGFVARLEALGLQRDALARHTRVVVYDQRGHGRSGWNGPRSATMRRLARDLANVIESTTGDDQLVLVGHSLGGMVVMALAQERPDLVRERVAAVGLLSSSTGPAEGLAAHAGMATACLWAVWALAPLIDAVHPFRTSRGRRWLHERLFSGEPTPATSVEAMERMWAEMPQSMAAAFHPAIVAFDATGALPVLRDLPNLVLTGTADATIPPAHSERLARELGGETAYVAVAGAGHMAPMTNPEDVNAALLQLLERVAATEAREAA